MNLVIVNCSIPTCCASRVLASERSPLSPLRPLAGAYGNLLEARRGGGGSGSHSERVTPRDALHDD